jgi:hypothetical protein
MARYEFYIARDVTTTESVRRVIEADSPEAAAAAAETLAFEFNHSCPNDVAEDDTAPNLGDFYVTGPGELTDDPADDEPALPKGLEQGSPLFRNFYECECGHSWEDEWDCGCDDECGACGATISPTESEALNDAARLLSAE